MNKNLKNALSLALALSMSLCAAATASAMDVNSSGGTGTTPVSLSSTVDGTFDGDPAATAMSVTVPTALPMAMAQDGTVTTANNCMITNNSYGAVRVKKVSIAAASDWSLTAFGDKSILAGEKVDSNKLGFALTVGGGTQVATDASNAAAQNLITAPVTGCYMTGVGNPNANKVAVDYDAIVTPLSTAITDSTVANVIFVIEWDS